MHHRVPTTVTLLWVMKAALTIVERHAERILRFRDKRFEGEGRQNKLLFLPGSHYFNSFSLPWCHFKTIKFKQQNLKSWSLWFLSSMLACKWIFIKTHSIESRLVIGLQNILFAGVCMYFFEPRNLTGWSSEGVKYLTGICTLAQTLARSWH